MVANPLTRSKFGPAAGASGGAVPKPTRLVPPTYVRLGGPELDALWNRTGHELAGSLYLLLIGGSVFKGPQAGQFLGTYARLQALLRPPKPERGQWAAPPTLKRVRTALDALEGAGLVERDATNNQAQGQLRLTLPHRAPAKPTAKAPPKPTATAIEQRVRLAVIRKEIRSP